MQVELLISAAVAATAAATFLYVGNQQRARRLDGPAQEATLLFAGWWWGIAGYSALVGTQCLLAAFDVAPPKLFSAFRSLGLVLLVTALHGLTYYLVFLYTGNRRWLPATATLYAAIYSVIVYVFAGRAVVGVSTAGWEPTLVFDPALTSLDWALVLALLAVPQIVGALAYLSLARRLEDATARYRVRLVSGSIVLWFGSSYLAGLSGDATLRLVAGPMLGLGAALASLWAYRPPAFLQDRLGVRAFLAER